MGRINMYGQSTKHHLHLCMLKWSHQLTYNRFTKKKIKKLELERDGNINLNSVWTSFPFVFTAQTKWLCGYLSRCFCTGASSVLPSYVSEHGHDKSEASVKGHLTEIFYCFRLTDTLWQTTKLSLTACYSYTASSAV